MNRDYPSRPLLGVGAVIVKDGRVLLIMRGKEPAKGQWSIPGGLVERGETLHDAVIREAREETGLFIEAGECIAMVERIFPDDRGAIKYHYVLFDYAASPRGGTLRAGTDADDARFFLRDEIDDLWIDQRTRDMVVGALEATAIF
jgi:8-oxo-dGTP diphosphatase